MCERWDNGGNWSKVWSIYRSFWLASLDKCWQAPGIVKRTTCSPPSSNHGYLNLMKTDEPLMHIIDNGLAQGFFPHYPKDTIICPLLKKIIGGKWGSKLLLSFEFAFWGQDDWELYGRTTPVFFSLDNTFVLSNFNLAFSLVTEHKWH